MSLSSLLKTCWALAPLLLACETAQAPPQTPEARANADACEGLAYVFFLVADKRDHGTDREEQIETARESVANPFTRQPVQTGRDLRHVIDLVYRHPEASAAEIEAKVRANCQVDARGQAVLRTLWPAGPDPGGQLGGGSP
jgi:hypothetical protein